MLNDHWNVLQLTGRGRQQKRQRNNTAKLTIYVNTGQDMVQERPGLHITELEMKCKQMETTRYHTGRVAGVDVLLLSQWGSGVYRGDTKDWGRFAETQLQATCEKWRQEKRKQITASSVQKIISLNKISSKGKEMLYSSFEATMQQIRTYQWEWNEESVCWENAGNPP